jgi:hypothetical protein
MTTDRTTSPVPAINVTSLSATLIERDLAMRIRALVVVSMGRADQLIK